MTSLLDKIRNRAPGIGLYGIVPPKRTTDAENLAQIASRQCARARDLSLDGLVVYDIQDESARNVELRPFPFLPTIDPVAYAEQHLSGLTVPKIVYRAIPATRADEFRSWLHRIRREPEPSFAVFVGASASGAARGSLGLNDAYALAAALAPNLVVGGIAIAERHGRKLDEHHRILDKSARGCRFFVTQAVYDASSMKSLLSDYALKLEEGGGQPVPIICTFAPCGSPKTLEFMKWLGISFPRWLENELVRSPNTLERSVELCEAVWADVLDFAREKRLPLGLNVESVSIRRAEIDASVELFRRLKAALDRPASG